jgi:very-short-patch-repair endonuclease
VIGEQNVDFACTKVRLVVEVDGGSHEGRARHDAARDRALNALGWRVIRVSEREVIEALDSAVARVVSAASGR